jgi:hypothetical protein
MWLRTVPVIHDEGFPGLLLYGTLLLYPSNFLATVFLSEVIRGLYSQPQQGNQGVLYMQKCTYTYSRPTDMPRNYFKFC